MERDNTINVRDRDQGHIWRYLRNGKVTHALSAGIYGHALFSRCGLVINPFGSDDWLGTGNQTEYDRAASLPRCRRCVRCVSILPPLAE